MFDYFKLLRKYNTLESQYESLKSEVKEDCFNKLISKLGEPYEIKRTPLKTNFSVVSFILL